MRKLLLCIMCSFGLLHAQSQQNIARIEYYIDTDPGFGSATPLAITAGTDIQDVPVSINLSGFTEGTHRLYVRAKDAVGNWSLTNTWLFYKPYSSTSVPSIPNITRIEYYIDDDPGYGNASTLTMPPGTDIQDAIIGIDPAGLSQGVHRLNVRAKDANGNWSLTNTHLFYKPYSTGSGPVVQPLTNLVKVEYYLDNDPGTGNATDLSVTPGTSVDDVIISINPSQLSEGVHRLCVRAKDANGNWSLTNTHVFYKPFTTSSATNLPPAPNLSLVEYYMDNDPGLGNAIPLTITTDTSIQDAVIPIDLAGLSEGVHRLFIRAKDANGNWSLTNMHLFYRPYGNGTTPPLSIVPNLTRIEYYIDTDPGLGSASALPVTADTNIQNIIIAIDPGTMTDGVHRLYVRAKDANGNWGLTATHLFYKPYSGNTVPQLAPAPNLSRVEYYLDNDPGYGNATALVTPSDTSLQDAVISINPASFGDGVHRLQVRARDANGKWSLTNTWLFYKPYNGGNAPVLQPAPVLNRIEYYVDTDPGYGNATNLPFTANTDISDIVIPVNTASLTFTGHTLYVRARDANGNWSLVNKWVFQVAPTSTIYATIGALTDSVCAATNLRIPFTVNTPFGTGNIFTAQLSNKFGSFAAPVTIGTLTGTASDTINATIPSGTLIGTGYLVRIISTNPADTSNTSSDSVKVLRKPEQNFSITGSSNVCPGIQAYIASYAEPDVFWRWQLTGGGTILPSSSTATINWATSGYYTITLSDSNSCGVGVVRTLGVTVGSLSPTTAPVLSASGRTLTASALPSGASGYHWYRNGSLQSSATSSTLYAPNAGIYTVRFYNSCGESPTSNSIEFTNDITPQTITFPAVTDRTFGDAAFVLGATASSGLPVTYRVVSGPVTLRSDTVIINGAGTAIIEASQPGNTTYQTATVVNRSFTIAKATQTVSFDTIPNKVYGGNYFQLTAVSSSGLPVYYTITSGAGTISGSYFYLTGAGSVTVRATQAGNQNYLSTYTERAFCIRPTVPASIAGFQNVCISTPSAYSIQPISGVVYTWALSGGGTLSSSTGSSVSINWSALGPWQLTVTATNPCDTALLSKTISIQVNSIVTPAAPTNLYPPNNTIISSLPFTLSWMPALYAETYDLYVWPAATAQPVTPLVANLAEIGYTINSYQLPGLAPGAIYKWKVVSKSACRDSSSVVQTFSITNIPDLTVQNVQTPPTAFSGQTMSLSFQVKNIGAAGTGSASWLDYVYLSRDTILHVASGDILLGTAPNISVLNAGEVYSRSMTVQLPDSMFGTCYILVVSNGFDRTLSPNAPVGTFGEVSLKNNLGFQNFQVNLTPPPDLQVSSVVCPSDAFSGQSIPVQFRVTNNGAGDTKNVSWKDFIYVSADPLLNLNSALKLKELTHSGILKKDSSYTTSSSITLPANVFGNYYVFVVTDATQQVYEYAFENNNTGKSDTLHVFLTPTADLVASDIIVAPTTAVRNQSVHVSWKVSNNGANQPAAVERNWYDAIYISSQPTFSRNSATLLATRYPTPRPQMVFGESYYSSTDVGIPAGFEGAAYIYVLCDAGENVFEYNAESNNVVRSSAIQINAPDIELTQVVVPATAASGSLLSISWTIKNNGPGKLVSTGREDRIWLSPTATFNATTATLIYSGNFTNALDTGATATLQTTVPLAQNISGAYYIIVRTNASSNIFESNYTNNILPGSPVAISLTPAPDLSPVSISLGGTIVSPGTKLGIHYEVMNQGPASLVGGTWTDGVYLSKQPVWAATSAVLVKSISRIASLAVNESYTVNDSLEFTYQMLTTLQAYAATCYIYVVTDAGNTVYEYNAEGNNTIRSSPLMAIQQWRPDLAVTAISGSDSAIAGQQANVAWTVTNYSGSTANYSGLWYDGIFLSRDTIWDAGDVFVTDKVIYGPLAKDSSYAAQFPFTVPNGSSGVYYLLLVADHRNVQGDANLLNNYKLIRNAAGTIQTFYVTMPPPADLFVTSFTAPSPGYSGQPVTLSWTVKNRGAGITNQASWTDRIYLSNTTQVSSSSQSLVSVARSGNLRPDSSYTVQTSVTLPVSVAGNYYMVVRTDENNSVYEGGGENNNTAAAFINIIQPPPADLVPDSITIPAQVLTGDSITIGWLVKNMGANPATGVFSEGIYLSSDSVYDAADLLLQDVTSNILLASSLSERHSKRVKIKGNLVPGEYYVIIRTDLRNNIVESNDSNNVRASTGTIKVDVRQLPISVLTPATLQNNNELYYKIVVPDTLRGEAMMVSLRSDSLAAVNELYVSYGNLPTRIQHDFAFGSPFSRSQDVVVPALDSGNYYVLAYGTVPAQQQAISLLAKKISFEILNITAAQGGNTGSVTIKISGAKFENGMTAQLYDATLGIITAHTLYYVSSTLVYASFNLAGAVPGLYDVKLTKLNDTTASLPDGFRVTQGSGGSIVGGSNSSGFYCSIRNVGVEELLGFNVEYPPQTRTRRVFPMVINFGNAGNVDIPAPTRILVSISGDPLAFNATGISEDKKELVLEFKELNGPPGILRPGAIGSIIVFTQSLSGSKMVFKIIE